MTRWIHIVFFLTVLCMADRKPASAESRIESNVIYGMFSGAAMLLDVHNPETPNGYGLIQIPGSAFQAPLAYAARPLKANWRLPFLGAVRLMEAGYTVFTVNHRAASRFLYPAAVEDVQRAVRYVRHNAEKYGINADRIGSMGSSSGGNLALMLGVLDGKGDQKDPDPVNRESAKVQTVATMFAPVNMVLEAKGVRGGSGAAPKYLGVRPPRPPRRCHSGGLDYAETKLYKEASVDTYVSSDDPPFLLVHGDQDRAVAFEHSVILETKLRDVGVEVKLIKMVGGGHGASISAGENPPDHVGAMIEWFDLHLRQHK